MSRGTIFLELVTGKIKNRLAELEQTIQEVKEDIHSMNDYYWENYTEMDEYGYENFDNQRALRIQVDANQENKRTKNRLQKMLDAPFFGSVSFRYEDGEVTSKCQYKIHNGRMIYEFESDVKIDDEILKEELGKHGDIRLKNIIRTIQKEQNAIIRNTKDKVMIIQGAAGSGKTSIALHRIAYLLYHDRKNLHASNVLVLSPNK